MGIHSGFICDKSEFPNISINCELCRIAVENNGWALQYVPGIAVEKDGDIRKRSTIDPDYPKNCIINIYFVKGISRDDLFSTGQHYGVTANAKEFNEIHVHRKGNKFRLLDIGNNAFCGLNELCRQCAKHFKVTQRYMQKIFVLAGLSSSGSVWHSNDNPVKFWKLDDVYIEDSMAGIDIPLAAFPKAVLKETTAIYTSILAGWDDETEREKAIPEEYSEFSSYQDMIEEEINYFDDLESCAFIVPDSVYLMNYTEEDVVEYTRIANNGNEYAQYRLAEVYLDEEYTGQDTEKGIYWLQKACEKQHGLALDHLGHIYAEGKYGVKKNMIHAYVCLKAAMDSCDSDKESVASGLIELKKGMSKKEIAVANSMNYDDLPKMALPE